MIIDRSQYTMTNICKTTLFLVVTFHSWISFAQSNDDSFKKFQILAGANAANMNFNKGVPAPAEHISPSFKTGFTFGVLINFSLADNILLQPGYYFSQRNGADKSTSMDYSMNYLSLPVLLSYNISPAIAVAAGPQIEILISAKNKINGVSNNITHDTEERSIGLTAGIDCKPFNSFLISARYMHGLNHIGIGQRSNIKEFKFEVVNLMLGFAF
ncbi:MAG: porin family protein [Ginsengibacter sp.]